MTHSEHRVRFSADVGRLIDLAWQHHAIHLALGEVGRTRYQQAEYVRTGRSRTMNSDHLNNLAVDFVFYMPIGGRLHPIWSSRLVSPIAKDWFELDSDYNYWGWSEWGFDTPHFGRRMGPNRNLRTARYFGAYPIVA